MAAAISTNLFVLGLVVLHAVIVLSTKPRSLPRWIDPTFPVALAANLLSGGGGVLGMLILVWSGWTGLRSRRWVTPVMASMAR